MKKQMFEVQERNGKTIILINPSSLSILQECQRKADYFFNQGLLSESNAHMDFGTIVHHTLASWYTMPPEERSVEVMAALWQKHFEESGFQPIDDRKTFATGLAAMVKYATVFAEDRLVIMKDAAGVPLVERTLESKIFDIPALNAEIWLFGTIDAVVKNVDTEECFVMDHKTATSLGEQWMNLWKPNHQMSAYILLAQRLGIPVVGAMIQGIQVVKTKQEVVRVETRRTVEELEDFLDTVVYEASRFLHNTNAGFFPGASAYTCSGFSGCQFLSLCQAGKEHRKLLIQARRQELEMIANGTDGTFTETREHLANGF